MEMPIRGKKIRDFLKKNAFLFSAAKSVYTVVYRYPQQFRLFSETVRQIKKSEGFSGNRIFYIGIPVHSNLGDMAQGMCIRRWLKKHYSENHVVELETNSLVNTRFSALSQLKKAYREGDMVIYQSGYTTTDLGGYADEMHRAVMTAIPQAKMLMMPQTIFFQDENNKVRTSQCYNGMKRMLFLARDRVSYNMALEMFPDVPVVQFPDIVTSLIGTLSFDSNREGILFCCRDDTEKLYSDSEIALLEERCKELDAVYRTDTTKALDKEEVLRNGEKHIIDEIRQYSKYRVIVTDRYHGTIFSLVAGTPVVIIKSTDHKVTTGAEWFRGIYDDYVYVAEDLDDAYRIVSNIYQKTFSYKLEPHFEKNYYDNLKALFEERVQ